MSEKCASRVELQCLRAKPARQTPKLSDVVGSTAKANEKHGQSEPWGEYLRAIAIPMMQFYREASVTCAAGEDFTAPAHLVGGQIDFTVVDAHGGSTETIHRWDDKISQPITPFVEHKTVQPFPSMNRQQRRAAERDERKRAG